jgi:hypothetical protein
MTSLYTAWVLQFHLKVSFAIRVKAGVSAQHIDPYSGTGRSPSATPLGSGSLQSYSFLCWPWGIGLFHQLMSFCSFVLRRMVVVSSLAPRESAISTCNWTAATTICEDIGVCGQSYISGRVARNSPCAPDTYTVDILEC